MPVQIENNELTGIRSWSTVSPFTITGVLVLVVIVLVAYFPALRIGFYLDDWWDLEEAGRLGVSQYIARAFDFTHPEFWPSYRPLLGAQIGLEYLAFGNNPLSYHIVPIAMHIINSLLLGLIVWQVLSNRRVAFLSGLFFGTIPVFSQAVFLPTAADPLMTLFYLLAIWLWLRYLKTKNNWYYGFTLLAFVMSILTKEVGVTLPVTLFLADWLLVKERAPTRVLLRRYFLLGIVLLLYIILELFIQPRTVNLGGYGLRIGMHIVGNTTQYLAALLFPWDAPQQYFAAAWGPGISETITDAPHRYLGALLIASLFVLGMIRTRSPHLLFLGLAAILNILPVIGFQSKFTMRFLYLSGAASAIGVALLIELVWRILKPSNYRYVLAPVLTGVFLVWNANGIASAAQVQYEDAQNLRAPFRDIWQRHQTFPNDTLLYFIDPYVELRQLSGMFFLRYGTSVSVKGRETGEAADLWNHNCAFIYYFVSRGVPIEVQVRKDTPTTSIPPLPARFDAGLLLERYEISSRSPKQGEDLVLLLYWRVTRKIDRDYTFFAHWIDRNGAMVSGFDDLLNDYGAPTSSWRPGSLIVSSVIMPFNEDIPVAKNYHLELGLYHLPTMQRASIVDERGIPITDQITIGTFDVE